MHFEATRRFQKDYKNLPVEIKDLFKKKLKLLIEDPQHPSLRHTKMVGYDRVFEFSITTNYRVTYERIGDEGLLRRIGTHNILKQP